jgi:hypothetical protein
MTEFVSWFVFAGIALAIVVLLGITFGCAWLLGRRQRAEAKQRGFEVNPVGPMPAGLKERDEDHG